MIGIAKKDITVYKIFSSFNENFTDDKLEGIISSYCNLTAAKLNLSVRRGYFNLKGEIIRECIIPKGSIVNIECELTGLIKSNLLIVKDICAW